MLFSQEIEDNEDSDPKRSKKSEENAEKTKELDPYKDFIHVRARRGQATDSHSLAERVSKNFFIFLLKITFLVLIMS